MTPEEIILWARLRRMEGWKFRRQQVIGRYIVDFACFDAKLVVEVDGSQHGSPKAKPQDAERDAWLRSAGYEVVRVWNSDIHTNLDGVLEEILFRLKQSRPPSP